MNKSPAIEVQDLHKTYKDGFLGRKRFEALKGVTFRVERGEIFGLLGPNGAGKTTFIKIMLGIVKKSHGTATMLDRPAGVRASRREVGYLPENLLIPGHHNAYSALRLYGQLSDMPVAAVKERQDELLHLVGLTGREKDKVRKYSKGMLQRLGLAQALLHDPDLLFLDEPTDGLDPVGRKEVRQLLQRLKDRGKTIFLNSHLLLEVEQVCDRVAILDKGILKRVGPVGELIPQRTEGIQLEIEVRGTPQALLKVFGSDADPIRTPQGSFKVRHELHDQQQVDACIDLLRSEGVSIVSMTPHRINLEEAFMDILSESEPVLAKTPPGPVDGKRVPIPDATYPDSHPSSHN